MNQSNMQIVKYEYMRAMIKPGWKFASPALCDSIFNEISTTNTTKFHIFEEENIIENTLISRKRCIINYLFILS